MLINNIGRCYLIKTKQFKTFDSNNFTLSSMFSFQNVWPLPVKRFKAVYTSNHLYLFIFLVRIGSDHNFLS